MCEFPLNVQEFSSCIEDPCVICYVIVLFPAINENPQFLLVQTDFTHNL